MANNIHLEGLPSDAFDDDSVLAAYNFERYDPSPSETDYSSWPAESSPAPVEEAHEVDDDDGDEEEEAGSSAADTDVDVNFDFDGFLAGPGEEFDEEEEEEEDTAAEDEDEDEDEHGDEEEDAFEYVFEDELEEGDLEGEDGFASEGSDSLFVDQHRAHSRNIDHFSASLEDILYNVRRNHARAVNLVSELQFAHSLHPFSHEQAPRSSLRRESVGPSRDNHQQRGNQRHHPYGMPQDRNRLLGRMPNHEGGRTSNLFRDELVEVEMQTPRPAPRQNRAPAAAQPEVIDLTGEPDSPDEPQVVAPPAARGAPNAPQNAGRNPRRGFSSLQRTPSLSRSDGSLLGGNNATVIDLTLDDSSPAAPPAPPPLQLPRRNQPDGHQHHHQQHRAPPPHARARPPPPHELAIFDAPPLPGFFGGRIASLLRQFTIGRPNGEQVEVQIIGGHMDDPLAGNIPNLDYRGNGHHGGGGAPKPQHVPPPAAREGFTRDTGSEDDVIVCPSCEKELKYDPDAEGDPTAPRPAKKARNRKDHEEHYFWALKECGHVYCKECYDNRKSAAKSSTAHFRRDPENNRKVLCAVADCNSDASNKQSWVGLFL